MRFFDAKFWFVILALFAFFALFAEVFSLKQKLDSNQNASVQVLYNHSSEADNAVVAQIQNAKTYVYVAMYTFTRQNIVDALVAAKLRGLDVRLILDFSQSESNYEKPVIKKLQKYGITIERPFTEKGKGVMHIKMLVTEKSYASGSYNWTSSATSLNDEVLEIGEVASVHEQYFKIFNELFSKYSKFSKQ